MRLKVLSFFLLSVFIFKGSICYGVDITAWTELGVYGGRINDIKISPANPDILMVATNKNIFKSINQGVTWQMKNVGDDSGDILSVLFDPDDGNKVFANANGVYRSDNGGESWGKISSPGKGFQEIIGGPGNVMYASEMSSQFYETVHLFRSDDGGETWQVTNLTLPESWTISSLVVDSNNHIIVGTIGITFDGDGDIWRSTDGGDNWDQIGLSTPIYSLAIDTSNPDNIYAGGKHFYKSTDNGVNWDVIDSGIIVQGCNRIKSIVLKSSSTLFASNEENLYKSTDTGQTWSKTSTIDIMGVGVPFDAKSVYDTTNDIIYIGNRGGGGVYKSTDAGVTFISSNEGLSAVEVKCLAKDPNDSDIMYAGSHLDLYKSVNDGETWSVLITSRAGVGDIVVRPTDSNILFLGDGSPRIYKSIDSGLSWIEVYSLGAGGVEPPDGFAGGVFDFCIDKENPDIIYAGTGCSSDSPMPGDGLYRSTDCGNTWSLFALEGSVIGAIAIDPNDSNIIYAGEKFGKDKGVVGKEAGVHKSIDGGNSWQSCGLSDYCITDLVVDDSDSNLIYAITDAGLHKSEDAGETWTDLDPDYMNAKVFTIYKSTSNYIIYIVGHTGDLHASNDGGQSWILHSTGFKGTNVLMVGSLYAGTQTGLYKYSGELKFPSANLSKIKVYPNPYNPKTHTQGLKITDLTTEAEIKIYTISGDLVKKVEYTTQDGNATWYGKNNANLEVASGVYIAFIKSSEGEIKRVKIAVER